MGKVVRRKNLFHRNHLVVPGDLRIGETLCVGGNLTVMGDLHASAVYCLGRLVVHGEIRALTIYSGLGIEVKGDLHTVGLTSKGSTGSIPDFDEIASYIVAWAVSPTKVVDDPTSFLADEDVVFELEEYGCYSESVVVGGDCIVSGPVESHGNITVHGFFNPDDADILGATLSADRILVEGDLRAHNVSCAGLMEVEGVLEVPGSVECNRLVADTIIAGDIGTRHCDGNIDCVSLDAVNVTAGGSITCQGPITCAGYLRAQGCITASGCITAGKDYGILAGLGVPRSEWLRAGYICGPTRPSNILTGLYRPLASRLKRFEDPRPARIRLL